MTIVWSNVIIGLLLLGLFLGFIIFLAVGLFRLLKHTINSEKTLKRIEEKIDNEKKEQEDR